MKKLTQAEYLPIDKLKPFEGHPFYVKDDDDMEQLTESIRQQGVLNPIMVRPLDTGEYEVISGHRRLHACKKAGIEMIPAFIYSMDRSEAVVAMVDSNLHREKLLPSEKAFAYKMKMDAMKHQGTSRQLGTKLIPLSRAGTAASSMMQTGLGVYPNKRKRICVHKCTACILACFVAGYS